MQRIYSLLLLRLLVLVHWYLTSIHRGPTECVGQRPTHSYPHTFIFLRFFFRRGFLRVYGTYSRETGMYR